MAAVVLRPGQEASADELIASCRQHIAGYKAPKEVVFLDAPPRAPTDSVPAVADAMPPPSRKQSWLSAPVDTCFVVIPRTRKTGGELPRPGNACWVAAPA